MPIGSPLSPTGLSDTVRQWSTGQISPIQARQQLFQNAGGTMTGPGIGADPRAAFNPQTGGGSVGSWSSQGHATDPSWQFANLDAMSGGRGQRLTDAAGALQGTIGQQKGPQQGQSKGPQQAPARLTNMGPGVGGAPGGSMNPLSRINGDFEPDRMSGGLSDYIRSHGIVGPGQGGAGGSPAIAQGPGSLQQQYGGTLPNWSAPQQLAQRYGMTSRNYYDPWSSPWGAPRYGASQGFNQK